MLKNDDILIDFKKLSAKLVEMCWVLRTKKCAFLYRYV